MIRSAIPHPAEPAEENDFRSLLTAGSAAGGDQRTDGHGCGAPNIAKGANPYHR